MSITVNINILLGIIGAGLVAAIPIIFSRLIGRHGDWIRIGFTSGTALRLLKYAVPCAILGGIAATVMSWWVAAITMPVALFIILNMWLLQKARRNRRRSW